MLLRSVDDSQINSVFPNTFEEYKKWDKEKDKLPPEEGGFRAPRRVCPARQQGSVSPSRRALLADVAGRHGLLVRRGRRPEEPVALLRETVGA